MIRGNQIVIMIFVMITFSIFLPMIFGMIASITSGNASDVSQLSPNLLGDIDIDWGLVSMICFTFVGLVSVYYFIRWAVRHVDVDEDMKKRKEKRIYKVKKEIQTLVSKGDFGYNQHRLLSDQMSNVKSGNDKQPVVSGWKPSGDKKEKTDGRKLSLK